jgi:hypothetical protein
MRTIEEVKFAFTSVGKLDEITRTKLLKLENSFKELATDILDLVSESADRTACLRKLLESKFTAVQALTHYKGVQNVTASNNQEVTTGQAAKKRA